MAFTQRHLIIGSQFIVTHLKKTLLTLYLKIAHKICFLIIRSQFTSKTHLKKQEPSCSILIRTWHIFFENLWFFFVFFFSITFTD